VGAIEDDLEFVPLFQSRQGFGADGVRASLVEEINSFCIQDAWRLGKLFLGECGGCGKDDEESEKRVHEPIRKAEGV